MSQSFQMETLKHPSHYNPFPLHRHSSKWPHGFREADRQLGNIPEKSPPRLKTALGISLLLSQHIPMQTLPGSPPNSDLKGRKTRKDLSLPHSSALSMFR